jgi:prepilin-type N-terminal cleavage/methylation domain-containing protein
MAQALQGRLFVAKGRSHGFTLIEMMIVVVIIGVLSMLAVIGYRKLVQSAHVSEATGMVNNIRVAQEAYHAEAQQYADISSDLTSSWYPRAPSYGVVTGWGANCASGCKANMQWTQLPLHVDGPVLFGYATIAGPADPSGPAALPQNNSCNIAYQSGTPTPDWYVVMGKGELDGNPSDFTYVCTTSWSNQIFVVDDGK